MISSVCKKLDTLSIEGCPPDALASLARSSEGGRIPAAIIAEQARPKISIGHAMDLVGALLKQVVAHEDSIRHVIFIASGTASADVLEKAVRSIAFKSHQVLATTAAAAMPLE